MSGIIQVLNRKYLIKMGLLLKGSGKILVLIVFILDILVSTCCFIILAKFPSGHFNKFLSEVFMHT